MKQYINLLPPEQQRSIRLTRLNSQVMSFGVWFILSLLVFATVLFASFLVLRQRLDAMEQEVAVQSKALDELKDTAVRKEVENFSQNLKNFETLLKARDNWSGILQELARNLPPDMAVDSLSVNRADRKIELGGRAATRSSVLEFRRHLLDSGHFANINFPLANLEKAENLRWKYRFFVNPAFLK